MGESHMNLKRKLEELGYKNSLPIEAVPLVECLLADLLQTTRSLQHYMDLSKEALQQRDSLMLEAEPYKCDNTRLIQENNKLHREVMQLKEQNAKILKDSKRKLKSLSEELVMKDSTISKLQHDLRDMSLRGLCAGTQSSRNKSRRKDGGDDNPVTCTCLLKPYVDRDVTEFKCQIKALEELNNALNDEVILLKNQVEHRENEVIRLNMLLEGGRPLSKDSCSITSDSKFQELTRQIHAMQSSNEQLKNQLKDGLGKQHEAMLRALSLADKNKCLQEELLKVDSLALKVEEDCNKKLNALQNEVNFSQKRIDELVSKNMQLQKEVSQWKSSVTSPSTSFRIQESDKEIKKLQEEIKELSELNKKMKEKITSLESNKDCQDENSKHRYDKTNASPRFPTKAEIEAILETERKMHERHMIKIEEKLSETTALFNKHLANCKDTGRKSNTSYGSSFVRDLQVKLCECEQKILMLKKENDEMKSKLITEDHHNKQNYKDIIKQLNDENAELSKENIHLSQQLNHYKNIGTQNTDRGDYMKKDVEKLKNEIEKITSDTNLLKRDKKEYYMRYKEAMDMVDKYKRDLALKQKEIDQLHEENSSYKMTYRTGKASADHLREECNFLREQIKTMQNDVIKEKTMASQIKNIQLETERSSNEVQNELLSLQKTHTLARNTIDSLERKCKDLQSEILSLKTDKSNLIDNIKRIDQERDKLVIELDHKTEANSVLEQKIKFQMYEITKLEQEISDLKRMLNINKVAEHKMVDSESQVKFLQGEIARLTQQFDNAIVENKCLQNSLADANGTLKITRIEYDKSRKEVDELRQQLQHYVAEIRRIEELLSHKEAERSDMLEHFASLSVEANILENTNHSLESESASKSLQLQSYVTKIHDLESQLMDKDSKIEAQLSLIADLKCKITTLESEVKLVTEEKIVLEQNVAHLKHMCNDMQSDQKTLGEADSELRLYETKIRSLSGTKSKLDSENAELKEKLKSSEKLLSNTRKEVIELKLALQDATSETKSLQERVSSLSRREIEAEERAITQNEFGLPLLLEETVQEESQEEDDEIDTSTYRAIQRRYSKFSHGSTL